MIKSFEVFNPLPMIGEYVIAVPKEEVDFDVIIQYLIDTWLKHKVHEFDKAEFWPVGGIIGTCISIDEENTSAVYKLEVYILREGKGTILKTRRYNVKMTTLDIEDPGLFRKLTVEQQL